jgi:hypothetical protein
MRENSFDEKCLVTVPHPPCSPTLPPFDFWLFGSLKTSRAGHAFNDIDELFESVVRFLIEIQR